MCQQKRPASLGSIVSSPSALVECSSKHSLRGAVSADILRHHSAMSDRASIYTRDRFLSAVDRATRLFTGDSRDKRRESSLTSVGRSQSEQYSEWALQPHTRVKKQNHYRGEIPNDTDWCQNTTTLTPAILTMTRTQHVDFTIEKEMCHVHLASHDAKSAGASAAKVRATVELTA